MNWRRTLVCAYPVPNDTALDAQKQLIHTIRFRTSLTLVPSDLCIRCLLGVLFRITYLDLIMLQRVQLDILSKEFLARCELIHLFCPQGTPSLK